MRVVVRNSPTHELTDLDERDAIALRAWYGHSASSEDERIALAVIRQAKAMDGWIECDCLAGGQQALLAPIRQERTFTLRRLTPHAADPSRNPDRPNHAQTCLFHVDRDASPPLSDRGFRLNPLPRTNTSYVDALPAIPTRLANVADNEQRLPEERTDRPSRLGAVLWRLLDQAGINVIPPLQDAPRFTLNDQLAKLRATARELRVLRTWTFNALLSTWADDYRNTKSRWQRLLDTSRPDWPKTERRTGFMLLFSPSVSASVIFPASSSHPIDVLAKVRQPLRGDPANRGPFLALLNADFQDDDDGPARAVQAYAQPIYNADTLFPVESGFEREVSHLLFWLQQSLLEAAPDLAITVTKPLFAIETPLGPCRPDFLVDAAVNGNHVIRLLVEALGMDTEEYRAAKARTIPRMRHLGPVFEITPGDLQPEQAEGTGRQLLDWVLRHVESPRSRHHRDHDGSGSDG